MNERPHQRLRVLLVDDSPEFLAAVRRHLAVEPWAEVIGAAATGSEAVRLASALAPDLVLVDVAMPGMDGFETARALKHLPTPPCVVMLTLHDNAAYRQAARQAGADGFVGKAQLVLALRPALAVLFPEIVGAT